MTREEIKKQLREINKATEELSIHIDEHNKRGSGFHYKNDPELAKGVDILQGWVNKIKDIVYQK